MWQKLLASLIFCFIAVTHPLQAFAQQTQLPPVPQPPQDYYYWHGPWPMPWVFMPLMMFLFMAICAGIMFFMMRRMGSHGARKSTMEMLNEGRARGEISESQYNDLRRILEN